MIKGFCAIILACGLAMPGFAEPPGGPSRGFEAKDLFALEAASDPQISPDGSKIVYIRRSGDIMTG